MKHDLLLLTIILAAALACIPTALVERAEAPTGTAVMSQSTPTMTTSPTAAVPVTATRPAAKVATATVKPAPSPPATSAAVMISPTEQTLSAGGSTTFWVSAPTWTAGSPPLRWSAIGLPAGVTSEFLPDANPANATLVVSTPCTLPRGAWRFDVRVTISQTTQTAQANLNVSDRLVDSQPGSVAGSFSANTISVRRGGPSTEQFGPFLRLQFCGTAVPRTLSVQVQSALSDAGTPLAEAPRFSLFKSLVFPAPEYIQTASGGYRPNAREVAHNDGWNLKWEIADGIYVLAFQRSPMESSWPAEKRPATIKYSVDIVR